jgi:hypothetical protein
MLGAMFHDSGNCILVSNYLFEFDSRTKHAGCDGKEHFPRRDMVPIIMTMLNRTPDYEHTMLDDHLQTILQYEYQNYSSQHCVSQLNCIFYAIM